jgi:hypothetical protein
MDQKGNSHECVEAAIILNDHDSQGLGRGSVGSGSREPAEFRRRVVDHDFPATLFPFLPMTLCPIVLQSLLNIGQAVSVLPLSRVSSR